MNKKDLFKNLTNEQLNKARACKNQEELLALAQQEGIELTDEQLEAVSGGCGQPIVIGPCPNCESTNIDAEYDADLPNSRVGYYCTCRECGKKWLAY